MTKEEEENLKEEKIDKEDKDDKEDKEDMGKKKKGKKKKKEKEKKEEENSISESDEEEDKKKGKKGKKGKVEKEDFIIIAVPEKSKGTNEIHLNIYSWWNFLPKNLWIQFSNSILNIYFLLLAVAQMFPVISVSGGIPTLIMTTLFFMLLTLIKDLMKDRKQIKQDRIINNNKTQVLNNTKQKDIKWTEIYPGHVCIIKEGQKIPTDCILLYSTNIDKKLCYIDPQNLDGQKNLIQKNMVKYPEEVELDNPLDYINNFVNSKIYYEKPNDDIFRFKGRMDLLGKSIPLTMENMLLRGSVLKNTSSVYCVVIYTG